MSKNACFNAWQIPLLFCRAFAGEDIIQPGEYRPANRAVEKGPDKTDDRADGTYSIAAIQSADKSRVARSAVKGYQPPRQKEKSQTPPQTERQRECFYIKFHFLSPYRIALCIFLNCKNNKAESKICFLIITDGF